MISVHSHSFAFIPKELQFFDNLIKKYLVQETETGNNYFYEETNNYWIVPRYFPYWIQKVYGLHDEYSISYGTVNPQEIDFKCIIEPRNELQEKAIAYLSQPNKRFGILKAVPGFGKTIVTIKAIHELKQKTLIVVPTNKLAKQWIEKFQKFTDIKDIPLFAGNLDKDKLMTMKVGIAIVNTLANRYLKRNKEIHQLMINAGIGVVVFDECHTTVPTPYFQKAQGILYANRYLGLSATPFRDDQIQTKIIYFNLGDDVLDIAKYELKPKVYEVYFDSNIPEKTKRWITWGEKFIIQRYLKKVVECYPYRTLVLDMIKQAIDNDRKVLIIAPRKETLQLFADLVKQKLNFNDIGVFWSGKSDDELDHQVIFATTQIFKEGVDVPHLDTLIILDQFSNRTIIEQQIGRILRRYDNKKVPKVVFLVDKQFPIQIFMSKKRQKIYNQIGFEYEVINMTQHLGGMNETNSTN